MTKTEQLRFLLTELTEENPIYEGIRFPHSQEEQKRRGFGAAAGHLAVLPLSLLLSFSSMSFSVVLQLGFWALCPIAPFLARGFGGSFSLDLFSS